MGQQRRLRRLRQLSGALRPAGAARSPGADPHSPADFPSCADALGITPSDDLVLMLSQLRRHGLCVLRDVIPADAVGAIRDAAIETARAHQSDPERYAIGPMRKGESQWWAVKSPFTRGDLGLAPYVGDSRLRALMEAAFGRPGAGISAVTSSAQINLPLCAANFWHTFEQASTAAQPPEAHWPGSRVLRPRLLNCLFFLSDFTRQNGGTWIVPGTHRRPAGLPFAGFHSVGFSSEDDPAEAAAGGEVAPHHETVHVTGSAGCVCCFDTRLWHCAPPNNTDEPRAMLNIRFAPTDLLEPSQPGDYERALVNGYATMITPRDPMTKEELRRLPPSVQPYYEASTSALYSRDG